jgi:ribosomal protein S12 methylthiotransferase accessory factor YcaO
MTGLPVVCAMSCDPDGRGLAFGFKAAADAAAAARGALMELLQMEIGLELARLRAARGAPADGDRGPLARAALAPERFAGFAALPPAGDWPQVAGFAAVAAHLADRGLPVTVADLPDAPGGIAVAKAFVPGLRPRPGPGPVEGGAPGTVAPLM